MELSDLPEDLNTGLVKYEKISPELAEKCELAKKRYFMGNFESLPKLADELGIKVATLNKWVHRGAHGELPWKAQVGDKTQWILDNAYKQSASKLHQMHDIGAEIAMTLQTRILGILKREELSVENYIKLMGTITNFFKALHPILRLEEGKSTENICVQGGKNMSPQEVAAQAVLDDPFGAPEIELQAEDEESLETEEALDE